MSKVFEALQRLERESGKLPSGVLAEAQKIFENGEPNPVSAALAENAGSPAAEPAEIPVSTPANEEQEAAEPPFGLDQVHVEDVTIEPATRIVYYSDPDSPGADRFRLLRMRLWPHWASGKLKTLLITSAHAGDGKSTVVLNLATALAEHGKKKVLIVEGDLCHPSLTHRLGLPNREGLADCVEHGRDPLSLLQRIEPLGWYLLPAGQPEGNPTELLQSPKLSDIFDAVRPYFDWIIVDTPPVIPLTDTLSLRQYVDTGLLVVRAGQTPRDAVEAAIGRVGRQNLFGIVLNGSDELDQAYSAYGKTYAKPARK